MAENNSDDMDSYLTSPDLAAIQNLGQGDTDCPQMSATNEFLVVKNLHEDEELTGSQKQKLNEDPNISSSNDEISIINLPNELQVHILSFLDMRERIRCELVCKHWRVLGKELPWTYPNKLVFTRNAKKSSLQLPVTDLTDDIFLSILSRCGSAVKQLMITSEHEDTLRITWKAVAMVGTYCSNLEGLKLYVHVNSECLLKIAHGCPKLKVVKIFNFGDSEHENGVSAIVEKCQSLECLAVSDLFMADSWFKVVNPKLRTLRMHKCTLMPSAMQNLMNRCNSLRELDLGFLLHMGIDEKILFSMFDHFKNTIKILEVMCIGVREYVNWCEGIKVLHNLEELCLNHCLSVENDLMVVIASECPNIVVLAIAGTNVTDSGLMTLQRLPNLRILDISLINRHVNGDGLRVLAKRGILEEVYMQSMTEITEENCCSLAKLCPNLQVVDLTATRQITNRLVKAFCAAIRLGYLKKTVKLVVGHTSVRRKVRTCEGLQLIFTEYKRGM